MAPGTKRGRMRARPMRAEPREGLVLDREAVRHWRLQRGYTQQVLAQQRAQIDGETVQISYAQLRRIEQNGRAGPATARILAALLGVGLAQLQPRDARSAACGLPRESSVDFVGRKPQIEAVLEALSRESSVRIAASLEGLPGIGKTELALQVCGRLERAGGYRIFWFDAAKPDLTPQWSEVVARHLGVEHSDPHERAKLALRLVESLAEPTLLVLDNAERWSASEPWPRPQGRHIRWLVTTRVNRLGDRAFEHVELPVLDATSAAELMARIAGPEIARRTGFQELLDHLGGYTIGVELAAAFLGRFPEVEPVEYLKALVAGKGDVLEGEVAALTLYQATLERALELLWERLPRTARAAAELAADFAQESASTELSDACGLDRKLRAQLRDFHLIQNEPKGWSMHRLVRAFVRRSTAPASLGITRAAFVRGCAAQLKQEGGDHQLGSYLRDRAHFDRALDLAGGLGADLEESRALLCLKVGTMLHLIGHGTGRLLLNQAIEYFRAQAARCDPALDLRAYGRAQEWLGVALYNASSGSLDRAGLGEALAAFRAFAGTCDRASNAREWARAQGHLSICLALWAQSGSGELEQLREAIATARAALEVYSPTEDPGGWRWVQSILGATLRSLAERAGHWELLFEAASAQRARLSSLCRETSPIAWAEAQHSLAATLVILCFRTGQQECGEQAVQACRAALEVQLRERMPLRWAHTHYALGLALHSVGIAADCPKPLQEAVDAQRLALSACDRKTHAFAWAAMQLALGDALLELGRRLPRIGFLEEALQCGRAALDVFAQKPPRPQITAQVQLLLGLASAHLGARGEERSLIERGVEHCRAAAAVMSSEERSPMWAAAQTGLGEALLLLGRAARSRKRLHDAERSLEAALSLLARTPTATQFRAAQQWLDEVRLLLAGALG
jgi:tetratricopeptide (TPR) repeat protein/transcriptional regulator with XRE-family HTH domain